jgi:hypothetical protein
LNVIHIDHVDHVERIASVESVSAGEQRPAALRGESGVRAKVAE